MQNFPGFNTLFWRRSLLSSSLTLILRSKDHILFYLYTLIYYNLFYLFVLFLIENNTLNGLLIVLITIKILNLDLKVQFLIFTYLLYSTI